MIEPEVLNILKRCEVNENQIKIIDDLHKDRPLYEKVDDILKRLRGKWNTSKQCHLFPYDVSDIFESVLDTGIEPPNNPENYYFTPSQEIKEILDTLNPCNHPDWHILEPSAGTAHIVREIKEVAPNATLHLVEWLDLNVSLLEKQGFDVWHGDFLQYKSDIKFDQVIMNPPFRTPDNALAYIDHIYHAFEMLKSKGQLAVIVPKGWTFRSDKKNVEFRNFVWRYLTQAWELPKGTFKEAGTNVETVVLILNKDEWKLELNMGFPTWNSWCTSLYLHSGRENFDECEKVKSNKKKFYLFLDNLVDDLNTKQYEGIVLSPEDKNALWEFVN